MLAVERAQALAVHVELLHSTLEPFARAWQQREPVGDHKSKGYQRRLERALLPFYSTGNVDEFSLTGEHLREAARALSAPVVTTSLARLKAKWQAEALDWAYNQVVTPYSGAPLTLETRAIELRRQAEEKWP